MLEGLLAPLRVVLHRSFADWLIVVATWLVILCATTLLAIGVLYGDAVSLSGLRQLIAAQPVTTTSLVVDMRVAPEELAEVDEVIGHQVGRVLGWTDGELARVISSGTYDFAGAIPDVAETDLAVFAAADRLDRHATLVDGTWPASGEEPLQVAISTAAADRLGISVGDELRMSSRAARCARSTCGSSGAGSRTTRMIGTGSATSWSSPARSRARRSTSMGRWS